MISSNPFKGGKKRKKGKVGMRKRFLLQRRSPTEPPANTCFVEQTATMSSAVPKELSLRYPSPSGSS